ncbi:MAG: transcriptional repressor [Deltaproteobacteria bacterium]|jgi:Fur family zinc uptake transcriptional regulator|nr:transcriptional repressor [Deltaproteobacteria bacterium]
MGTKIETTDQKVKRLLDEAQSYCAAQGSQLTQLRRLVLETLITATGPVKAYDLIDTLRERGHRLTPATVYRILEFFLQNGLVHRVNALNAFVACQDSHLAAHNPLIVVCPGCQTTTEINDEGLYTSIFNRLGALGFELKDGTVEVRGVCRKCAKEGIS